MKLKRILPKRSGRLNGRVTVRHQGGRAKRFLRELDWIRRDKTGIWAIVENVEYDPNRTADIALLLYGDGERRYILSPVGLEAGMKVVAGENAPLEVGCALPLKKIPVGTMIHAIEIKPGKGAQLVRSAGGVATLQGREDRWILVKMASGQIRRFVPDSYATIGQVGKVEWRLRRFRKAGDMIRRGIRPTVRGVAMNPRAHPHGGGEGRSGIGMKHPKTVYGRSAVGNTRRKRKYSDKLIVKGLN